MFFADILVPKITKAKRNLKKAAQFAFVQKRVCKMLMNLTPGVNFTNIL